MDDANLLELMVHALDRDAFRLGYTDHALYTNTPQLRATYAQRDIYVAPHHYYLREKFEPATVEAMHADADRFFDAHTKDLAWLNSRHGGQTLWELRNRQTERFAGLQLCGDYQTVGPVLRHYWNMPGMAEEFEQVRRRLITAAAELPPQGLYVNADGLLEVGDIEQGAGS